MFGMVLRTRLVPSVEVEIIDAVGFVGQDGDMLPEEVRHVLSYISQLS